MNYNDSYQVLCKTCFIKHEKPTKKEIKKIVLSDEKEMCECCGRKDYVVDYIEDDD